MKMSLIDHFNAFHVRSQELGLTPNARSLYFAILGEFNKMQYPAQIKLQNTYLQHLCGINSTCSFNGARNALINAGIISHKKQIYALGTVSKDSRNSLESVSKESRNTLETFQKDFRNSLESSFSTTTISKNNIEKEKEKEKEREGEARARTRTTTTTTPNFKDNGWVSAEVQETWFKYEGEEMNAATMQKLYPLEQMFDTKAVCDAIFEASARNKEAKLTFNFVEKILKDQAKGGKANGRNNEPARSVANAESWEQQQPDWLD